MSRLTSMWSRISSAFERNDIGVAGRMHDDARTGDDLKPTATRYAPIRKAVERRVGAFLREDLVSHLEIGFNEIFLLHYIEIVAEAQGEAELEQFLYEFSPEARVHWVKKLLGPALGKHVSLEQFLGLDKEFSAEQLAETDPFEEALHQVATPLYRVILHGRWESAPAAAQAAEPSEPARIAGPCLRLSVQDAKSPGGARVAEIEQFPAVLGSSVHADVEVSGYYVSARHCTLHWEGQRLWVADHSTNGTWVDGERVHRGSRVAVANGALLGFGRDRGDTDHDRYPAIRAQLMRKPVAAGATTTPVPPSSSTPVAPNVGAAVYPPAAEPPLAVLAIVDATGSPMRDVLELPFTIGRGSAQDYVVPEANEGVSREHLVLEQINSSGAVTLNKAVSKNGTFAGNQPLPERFVWRFGQEIVLGERWANAPSVRVALRPVKEKA